jgi:hypothetical protein
MRSMFEQSQLPPSTRHRNILIGSILLFALPILTIVFLIFSYGLFFSSSEPFDSTKWKSATEDERRRMADDFLKKYNTIGMTVAQLKEILGPPDYEHDSWMYNLSTSGAPPPGPQTQTVFVKHPRLCVHFKEGAVEKLTVCNGLAVHDEEVKDDMQFDPNLWKVSSPADRLKMVESLISSDTLTGRNKGEVKQRLGEPDDQSERHEIEYDLGIRMIDTVTLTFVLDAEGKVTHAQKIEH